MYKDRNIGSHQLSFSAVTNYQSSLSNNGQFEPHQYNQRLQKSNHNHRSSMRNETKQDLAFLRNTVGPSFNHNIGTQSLKLPQKPFDISLRQTTGNVSDIRDRLRMSSPIDFKKSSKPDFSSQSTQGTIFEKHTVEKGARLDKIMEKYQKKSETKEALKLLEELKDLKRKQQQLKKQRKGDTKVLDQTSSKYSTEFGSPVSFSKKNKVEYSSPSFDKKQLSTNNSSPQHESFYQNDKTFGNSFGQKIHDNLTITSSLQNNGYKSSSNLKTYYENKSPQDSTQLYHNKSYKTNHLHTQTSQTHKNQKYYPQSKSPLTFKKNQTYQSYHNILSNVSNNELKSQSSSNVPKFLLSPSKNNFNNTSLNDLSSTSRSNYSQSRSSKRQNNFTNRKTSINDFTLGKTLGQGKFGTVFQAYDKQTKTLYALKKVPKSIIKSHWMVDQFILQVKLQSFLSHQNILTLHTVFDDYEHVYLLLDYMEEGTLFLHLKKNQILDEKQAAIKLRQVSSAVQYLHENGIAHRDIKPQNIVLSHGVTKLCDFGWATICDERRKTYCGTFDYAAPEILQGTQYDMSVDLWCLGILAYEILVGKAPFYHISRKQTMKKIMNCQHEKINYPSTMSRNAKSFIEQLLKKNPEQRLKSEDLLNHPFLKSIEN